VFNIKIYLSILTHGTPGPPKFSGTLSLWVGAYVKCQLLRCPGWAWGGLCEYLWEPDNARGSHPHEGGFAKNSALAVQRNTVSNTRGYKGLQGWPTARVSG